MTSEDTKIPADNPDKLRSANYRELLTTLNKMAELPQPTLFGLTAEPSPARASMELMQSYCGDMAIYAAQLIYVDLGSKGIDPDLARLIVLALLVVDNAPITHLKEELVIAAADVVSSRTTATTAETDTTKDPVVLFPSHMNAERVSAAEEAANTVPCYLRVPEHAVVVPDFDPAKWALAMSQQIWGVA